MENDPILKDFPWINDVMSNPENRNIEAVADEKAAILDLCDLWGSKDSVSLFRQLSEKHGPDVFNKALTAVSLHNTGYWWRHLASEAPSHSFRDFYDRLWKDLPDQGFEFTETEQDRRIVFNVTRCPVADLAKELDAGPWLYALTCATDPVAIENFNPEIRFERDKTLMEGDDYCNHTYILP